MNKLDLSALYKANAALERALGVMNDQQSAPRRNTAEVETLRAGVIQCFEFTYELCWKFIRRWLELNLGAAYIEGVPRRELFRHAAEYHLIDDVDTWMEYHEARNATAHTYDEENAEEIFQIATPFLADAKSLLTALEQRND